MDKKAVIGTFSVGSLRYAPERLRRPSQRHWDVQKKGLPFTKKATLFKNSPS